ncbi:MAG TPA: glutamyl-tRNA reductase [Candidatus Methanoperedenaceae archaeon]|nr:glutamyl-tRNA reductase [Candidatus Methanoperedenaceae archaeon]
MEISSMAVTHVKAGVGDIEKMKAWHGGVESILQMLYSSPLVEECAILMTCNRVEVYVVSPKGSKVLLNFAAHMRVPARIIDFYDHDESLRHLLRITSGLESMIVGEDQILGQVKELYSIAKKAGTIGRTLETAFSKAIQVGKRVRTETNINKGSVSIGSAAVELAEDTLGGLEGKTVMVIGAGEMGSLVAHALSGKKVKAIYVANRTYEKAVRLAEELRGEAIRYEAMGDWLQRSDVAISATSAPHFVLTADVVAKSISGRKGPMLLIDIATPRDIDPGAGELPGVRLFNIDDLKSISDRNLKRRLEEAKKAEKIVGEELALLGAAYKRQQADEVISALYSSVEEVRNREREKAINRLRAYHTIGEIESEVLDDLTHSLINKILAEPTKVLRRAAENEELGFIETVSDLFRLDGRMVKK